MVLGNLKDIQPLRMPPPHPRPYVYRYLAVPSPFLKANTEDTSSLNA